MTLAFLALAGGLAILAAVVAARDAARRGDAWLQAGAAVGCVVLFGSSVVLAYSDSLAASYAAAVGRPGTALTPRELTALLGGVAAALTVAVLGVYGLVTRTQSPA